MDVSRWLEQIDLAQYAELFRANHIDADVLRGMAAEDLKELGISSFGHRRKLMAAIIRRGFESLSPPLSIVVAAAAD